MPGAAADCWSQWISYYIYDVSPVIKSAEIIYIISKSVAICKKCATYDVMFAGKLVEISLDEFGVRHQNFLYRLHTKP